MKKKFYALGLVALCCALGGYSEVSWAQAVKNAASGKPTPIVDFPFVDSATCKLTAPGKFIFEKQPANGRVEIRQVAVEADHRTCGRIKGNASRIVYTSRAGFVGADLVEFMLIIEPEHSARGARETRTYRVTMNVQR
jgi:hypothetical protein